MERCVCAVPGRGSGVIQVGPLYHPCCVDCGSLRGRMFAIRAAAQDVLNKHREGHGR
jgi:hypothetical protein